MSSRRLIRAVATARASSSGAVIALALIGLFDAGSGHARASATATAAPKADAESSADAKETAEEANDDILIVAHRQKGAIASDVKPETMLNSTAIRALGAADLEEVFEDLAPEIKNGQSGPGSKGTPASIVLVNGAARQTSDFGTLSTFGSTLEWSPAEHAQILVSFSHEQQAPSLMQLGEATLETPDLREYDFTNDVPSIVRRFEGGNDALKRNTSQVANFRLQYSPFRSTRLALSADYTIERSRNPIVSLTAATPAVTAAFPDHFTRSNDGTLTAIDISPVNIARRDRQQLRWGLNYTTPFGRARPAKGAVTDPPKPPVRNSFQVALYHTWRFQDDVWLRNGLPSLDLLNGDIITDKGGTPRHELELQTTLSTGAWSVAVNAAWQSPTKASAGPISDDR